MAEYARDVDGHSSAPFVGRRHELDTLQSVIERAHRHRALAIGVTGEAGIGKSRLLHELGARIRTSGGAVGFAHADEITADRPFGCILAAIDRCLVAVTVDDSTRTALNDQRATIAAELVDHTDHADHTDMGGPAFAAHIAESRYRVTEAIAELLDGVAQHAPVTLVLDDLHWFDESSVHMAATLPRRLGGLPIAVVGSYRPGDTSPALERFRADAAIVEVGPLDHTAVGRLLDGTPAGRIDRDHVGAFDGHPLFLTTALLHTSDGIDVPSGGGSARELFDQLVRARIARLDPRALDVLRAAAAAGRRTRLEVLLDLVATQGHEALPTLRALGQLDAAHLLTHTDEHVTFVHDLVREVVYREVPEAVRRSLHRIVADVEHRRGAEASRVARHLVLGGAESEETVRWLLAAARSAGPRDPVMARQLLREADTIMPADHPQRIDVLAALVEALGWTGEFDECEQRARRLLADVVDAATRARLRRHVALCSFLRNRPADAAAECDASADETDDPGRRARARAEAALAHLAAADPVTSRDRALDAAAQADVAGEAAGLCLALSVLSRLDAYDLDFGASLAHADRAVDAARRDPTGEAALYHPGFFRMLTLVDLDRLRETLDQVDRYRELAGRRGASWMVPIHHGLAAVASFYGGALDAAERHAAAGLASIDDTGSDLSSLWHLTVLALVAAERRDRRRLDEHVDRARHLAATRVPLLGFDLLALAESRRAELRGDRAAALDSLVAAVHFFDAVGMTVCNRVLGFDLLRLAIALGRHDVTVETVERLDEIADRTGVAVDIATAHVGRAAVDGNLEAAMATLDLHPDIPRPLRRAEHLEMIVPLLWAAGRNDDATGLLDRAGEIYRTCSATAGVRRVAQSFTAYGLRRRRPPQRSSGGWTSLTDRERTIVRLVVAGASNRAIAEQLGVSRRTVESHLAHVYAKLGVGNRLQLALLAREASPDVDGPPTTNGRDGDATSGDRLLPA